MKKVLLITSLIFLVSGPSMFSQSTSKGTLEIEFKGVRNNRGQMTIGLHNTDEGWPRKPQMNYQWNKVNLYEGVLRVKVPGLTYGTYAITVLDDENSNLEMEMFIGIPKEGWGFSMNPPFRLSAPKFNECSFVLNKPSKLISIDLRYAGKGK
ncbi:MAG: DUF2141 domain-containing protein [Bacteroidota bacterium]